MQTVLLAVGLTLLAMAALAMSALFGRPPVNPSCSAEACLGTCAGCKPADRGSGS